MQQYRIALDPGVSLLDDKVQIPLTYICSSELTTGEIKTLLWIKYPKECKDIIKHRSTRTRSIISLLKKGLITKEVRA